ncbi:hypothetical protein COBT_002928, partial [Conglomerata obtusa]
MNELKIGKLMFSINIFLIFYIVRIFSLSSENSSSDHQMEPTHKKRKSERINVKKTYVNKLENEEVAKNKTIDGDKSNLKEENYLSKIREIELLKSDKAHILFSNFSYRTNGRSTVMYGKYTIDFNFIRMNKILNNSVECGYT